jgi:hypothetical protein
MDPDDKVLLEGVNERQGDYIFTANKVGVRSRSTADGARLESTRSALRTMRQCRTSFSTLSTATESILGADYSIMVESEPRRQLSSQQQPLKEHTSTLEESTYKLNGLFTSIGRIQK